MFVTRLNQKVFERAIATPFITAILGPRRVGKSTLVQHFATQRVEQKWVFLNMDSRPERQRVEADELAKIIEERGGQKISPAQPLWVAIDEAQKCPQLFDQIKILYDRYKGSLALKFVLTGSGFLGLHHLAAETLAGRIELLHLREFGIRETAALQSPPFPDLPSILDLLTTSDGAQKILALIDELAPFRPKLTAALQEQMIWGGLPEVLQEGESMGEKERRIVYLGNYLQTYLEKDVRDIETISDLGLYQRMMGVIAGQTGSVREDKRILEALGCSRDTLKKYRGFLEATLVYREVYPYIGSSLRRLVKSPKGYLMNNGLVSYLTGIYDMNALLATGAIGHRFENWLLKEMLIWLDRDPRQSEVYFWRTSGNVEVDFIAVQRPLVIPFEATFSSNIERKKVKHLSQILREEKAAPFGCYLYNGEARYDKESRILFLPAWTIG